MFTGIVEELGTIRAIRRGASSAVLSIGAGTILDDLKVGDSVAVNGVCLTATQVDGGGFTAYKRLRFQHRVGRAVHLFLPDVVDVRHVGDVPYLLQIIVLTRLYEQLFQLHGDIEVIFYALLVLAQNDEYLPHSAVHRLFHHILQGGGVHDGQHLFGQSLGGR